MSAAKRPVARTPPSAPPTRRERRRRLRPRRIGLLAHLLAEPGGDVVRDSLAEQTAVISAVNWAEALTRLASAGADPVEVAQRIASEAGLGDALTVVALTASDGPAIAALRAVTRHLGLSLADRACLALAQRLGLPVLTTDGAWAQLEIGVEVRLARP
ncbi:MAG: type II toxin-antitoxin system VapC family toxin [Solirubrobacteraceae bacterium]